MPRLPAPSALLAAALLAAPASILAQTAVTGIVVDSTRAQAPLAGATVQLVSRTTANDVRLATTDSTGAFLLTDVAPGEYLLGFLHPRLDELALQPPLRVVRTADSLSVVRADLAVPGGRTVVAAICGAPSDSSGLLMGRVLGAGGGLLAQGAMVTVTWAELVIGGGEIRSERRTLTPPVTSDGRYVACGVPSDTPVEVHAAAGALASGYVELRARAGDVVQRDLLVSPVITVTDTMLPPGIEPPRLGTARLVGRVLGPNGRPVERSVVSVQGSGASDTTNVDGRFTLDALPAGTFTLEARAIGFVPRRVVVDLTGDGVASTEVQLAERLATLEPVTVFGSRRRNDTYEQFLSRARGAPGHFITPADIDRWRPFLASDLLRRVPGARVIPTGASGNVIGMRNQGGSGPCLPAVFVDGMLFTDGATGLDRIVGANDVAAMEVYVGMQVPAQYWRNECGTVLVWTKGRIM